jgi:AAA domain
MSAVIVIAADGGKGKTLQSSSFPEQIAFLDFEYPKGDKNIKSNNPDKLITIMPCREYYGYKTVCKDGKVSFESIEVPAGHKKGQIDIPSTNDTIKRTIDKVLDTSDQYETIVLDSVSDIRDVVAGVWLQEYQKTKKADRKVIGKDPSAWSAINKIVCDDILFPIINIGRIENKNIVFTSRLEDAYKVITLENGKEDTAKTGERIIDCQNWVTFEIDVICRLDATEKGKYSMYCPKTPKGVIPKMDITGLNVYDVLSEKGVI